MKYYYEVRSQRMLLVMDELNDRRTRRQNLVKYVPGVCRVIENLA